MKKLKTIDLLAISAFLFTLITFRFFEEAAFNLNILARLILFLLYAIGGYFVFAYPKEFRFRSFASITNGISIGLTFFFLILVINGGIYYDRSILFYVCLTLFGLNALPILILYLANKKLLKSTRHFKHALIRVGAPFILFVIVLSMSNTARVLSFYSSDSNKYYKLLQDEQIHDAYNKADNGEAEEGVTAALRALHYSLLMQDTLDDPFQRTLNALGYAYYRAGQYEKADSVLMKNLSLNVSEYARDLFIHEKTLHYMGLNYSSWGYYTKSDSCLNICLQHGADLIMQADIFKTIGFNANKTGKLERADSLYTVALAKYKQYDSTRAGYFITLYGYIAGNYVDQSRYGAADSILKKALNLAVQTYGPETQDVIGINNDLAELNYTIARYDSTRWYFSKSLRLYEIFFGTDSYEYLFTQAKLASVDITLSDFDKAEPVLLNILPRLEKKYNPQSPLASYVYEELSRLYVCYADYDKAKEFAEKAFTSRKYWSGMNNMNTAIALDRLAYIHYCENDYDQSDSLYMKSLSIMYGISGRPDRNYYYGLNGLGLVYSAIGNLEKADTFFLVSLKGIRLSVGSMHPDYALVLSNEAFLKLRQDKTEEAYVLFKKAVEIDKQVFRKEQQDIADILTGLAAAEAEKKLKTEAVQHYKEALYMYKKLFHFEHPKSIRIREQLSKLER